LVKTFLKTSRQLWIPCAADNDKISSLEKRRQKNFIESILICHGLCEPQLANCDIFNFGHSHSVFFVLYSTISILKPTLRGSNALIHSISDIIVKNKESIGIIECSSMDTK
jgi:hypothetical protein